MKKFTTHQKVVLIIGIVGVVTAFIGKVNGWEYMEFFPIFYASTSMIWISFISNKKSCRKALKSKEAQNS
ncbi:MAG: hypothetical protein JJ885_11430 [Muricauda sp.]|jgi:hypothetical protein|uniref:Uncharacterized protein n=1 Tax=Flagellimonas sp. MMG031 TaxID=3158549 RepID=A0AAU7MYG2_9FLAO|nr:hypothetical protein [Allomuricauda sp.]MBO6532277.1 hypothetical protein [Allomuricauda sp.]MBO6588397.1 hypothetical protein [Allomuricauda sp.]MBO6618463.1 hypothetical protein [Allomuricauda sp.]MBO6643935.1 hypothetical protein [Allomuricauda sp.]MBO6746819.1 hypothetical protein [Allomuricauda sp.]